MAVEMRRLLSISDFRRGSRYPYKSVSAQVVNSGTVPVYPEFGEPVDLGVTNVRRASVVIKTMDEGQTLIEGVHYYMWYGMGTITFLGIPPVESNTDFKVWYDYSGDTEFAQESTFEVPVEGDLILALDEVTATDFTIMRGLPRILVEIAWAPTRDGPFRRYDRVMMKVPRDVVRVRVPAGYIRLGLRHYGEWDYDTLSVYATFGPATGPYERRRQLFQYDTCLGLSYRREADRWNQWPEFYLPFPARMLRLGTRAGEQTYNVRLQALGSNASTEFPSGSNLKCHYYPEMTFTTDKMFADDLDHIPAGWYAWQLYFSGQPVLWRRFYISTFE